jgi:hypothetical protein
MAHFFEREQSSSRLVSYFFSFSKLSTGEMSSDSTSGCTCHGSGSHTPYLSSLIVSTLNFSSRRYIHRGHACLDRQTARLRLGVVSRPRGPHFSWLIKSRHLQVAVQTRPRHAVSLRASRPYPPQQILIESFSLSLRHHPPLFSHICMHTLSLTASACVHAYCVTNSA